MPASVFQYKHRVVYAECTVGNHVYYSRYLEILEAARGEFCRHLGCPLLQCQQAGTIFPVIGLDISYLSPARYDDLLTVEIWVAELGGVRLSIGFRIRNSAGTRLTEGHTRHVCTTPEEKPKRIPKELLERMQPYLASAEVQR